LLSRSTANAGGGGEKAKKSFASRLANQLDKLTGGGTLRSERKVTAAAAAANAHNLTLTTPRRRAFRNLTPGSKKGIGSNSSRVFIAPPPAGSGVPKNYYNPWAEASGASGAGAAAHYVHPARCADPSEVEAGGACLCDLEDDFFGSRGGTVRLRSGPPACGQCHSGGGGLRRARSDESVSVAHRATARRPDSAWYDFREEDEEEQEEEDGAEDERDMVYAEIDYIYSSGGRAPPPPRPYLAKQSQNRIQRTQLRQQQQPRSRSAHPRETVRMIRSSQAVVVSASPQTSLAERYRQRQQQQMGTPRSGSNRVSNSSGSRRDRSGRSSSPGDWPNAAAQDGVDRNAGVRVNVPPPPPPSNQARREWSDSRATGSTVVIHSGVNGNNRNSSVIYLGADELAKPQDQGNVRQSAMAGKSGSSGSEVFTDDEEEEDGEDSPQPFSSSSSNAGGSETAADQTEEALDEEEEDNEGDASDYDADCSQLESPRKVQEASSSTASPRSTEEDDEGDDDEEGRSPGRSRLGRLLLQSEPSPQPAMTKSEQLEIRRRRLMMKKASDLEEAEEVADDVAAAEAEGKPVGSLSVVGVGSGIAIAAGPGIIRARGSINSHSYARTRGRKDGRTDGAQE